MESKLEQEEKVKVFPKGHKELKKRKNKQSKKSRQINRREK